MGKPNEITQVKVQYIDQANRIKNLEKLKGTMVKMIVHHIKNGQTE